MTPFTFSGRVIPGEKVGRKIGFPTANLDRVPQEGELKPGVYAGKCKILIDQKVKQSDLDCLVYFGPRHIFGEQTNSFEIYIYHFDQNIYDHFIEVKLLAFLRPPQKLTDLPSLKAQLEEDKLQGIGLLRV